MDLYKEHHILPQDEKRPHDHTGSSHTHGPSNCEDCESRAPCHRKCHGSRLRRFLVPALAALLTLSAVLALSCVTGFDFFGLAAGGLVKRATDPNGNTDGTFVNNKRALLLLYITKDDHD